MKKTRRNWKKSTLPYTKENFFKVVGKTFERTAKYLAYNLKNRPSDNDIDTYARVDAQVKLNSAKIIHTIHKKETDRPMVEISEPLLKSEVVVGSGKIYTLRKYLKNLFGNRIFVSGVKTYDI